MSTRTLVCLFFGFVLIALGGWLGRKDKGEPVEPPQPVVSRTTADVVVTDGEAVFQRAFWRRPGEEDRILHAERREWMDGEKVTRWQWFLEVEPSEELLNHLREQNAFGLRKVAADSAIEGDAPEWFQPQGSGWDWMASGDGEMTLIFGPQRIFATGKGGGFVEGAEAPIRQKSDPSAVPNGRLPSHSPPLEK